MGGLSWDMGANQTQEYKEMEEMDITLSLSSWASLTVSCAFSQADSQKVFSFSGFDNFQGRAAVVSTWS